MTATTVTTTTPDSGKPRKRPPYGAILGGAFLIVLVLLAILADKLPFVPYPDKLVKVDGKSMARYKLGPGWTAWFGVDRKGEDVFAKTIYGARTTLVIGVGATVFGLLVGGFLGVVAGYFRGWVDRVVQIVTDCLLALPPLLLAILIVFRLDDIKKEYAGLGWLSKKWQITLTLGLLAVAPLARIVRAQTLSLREREFVLAARSLGAKNGRIIWREIMPNLVPAMLTVAFTGLGILIAAEGALAFLGLGVDIGTPTWGKLIDANRNNIDKGWWATIFPCLMLFGTIVSFNLIGDRMARRFDIREAAL